MLCAFDIFRDTQPSYIAGDLARSSQSIRRSKAGMLPSGDLSWAGRTKELVSTARGKTTVCRPTGGEVSRERGGSGDDRYAPAEGEKQHAADGDASVVEVVASDGVRLQCEEKGEGQG